MEQFVRECLESLARDLLSLLRVVMESSIGINEKVGRNTLIDSELYRTANVRVENIEILDVLLNDYIVYIEGGRKPRSGRYPPPQVILDFIHRKGIHFDGCTDNQTVFLISRSIWELGYKARPITEAFFEQSEAVISDFLDKLIDDIMDRAFE